MLWTQSSRGNKLNSNAYEKDSICFTHAVYILHHIRFDVGSLFCRHILQHRSHIHVRNIGGSLYRNLLRKELVIINT